MHAIIKQNDGKYYLSAVFGYYRNVTATEDYYQRHLERIHNPYYIVWDSEKKRLIKWPVMVLDTEYIIPQVLIVDANQDNWRKDENGEGCVDFLSKDLIDSILSAEEQAEDILEKCRRMDEGYIFDETPEIQSESDIENLEWASGGFHDAYIAEEKLLEDGSLYVKFEGAWGCDVEVWFWGDLEYDTSSRKPLGYENWYGATALLQDGFVYLIDEVGMTVEQINANYCYFKARHMKYHIIPV